MSAALPAPHLDLVNGPRVVALTTHMPDGQPQTTAVGCNYDGRHVLVNIMGGLRKEKNIRANPRVTLLIVDPDETDRCLQIRGEAELIEAGALEHLDQVTHEYTRHARYVGYIFPEEKRERETRIICRIVPRRTTLDAIHR